MDIKDALDVQRAPKWKRFLADKLGWKIHLKNDQREGWSGQLPFCMFKCPDCECLVCDYPHGHPHRRYLTCPRCGAKIGFVSTLAEIKDFFSTLFALFLLPFRLRFKKIR